MKMQVRKILIFAAVDDEPIGFEVKFLYETLYGGIQVCQEGAVVWVKVCQCLHLPLGDDKQMNLIAGRRMLKRNQVRGLTEALDWDGETHMGENPTDEEGKKAEAEKFTYHVSLVKRFVKSET